MEKAEAGFESGIDSEAGIVESLGTALEVSHY